MGRQEASLTSTAPATLAAIDPHDQVRLNQYLAALNAPLKMGLEAEQIPNALVPTMQSVLAARPDLTNTQFDFESDGGSVRVISPSMSANDNAWLQGKPNGNTALVQAVQAFHDDAVVGPCDVWRAAHEHLRNEQQRDAKTSFLSQMRRRSGL